MLNGMFGHKLDRGLLLAASLMCVGLAYAYLGEARPSGRDTVFQPTALHDCGTSSARDAGLKAFQAALGMKIVDAQRCAMRAFRAQFETCEKGGLYYQIAMLGARQPTDR